MISEKSTKQELLDEYKKLVTEAKTNKIPLPDGTQGLNSKNTKADFFSAIKAIQTALSAPAAPEVKPTPAPKPVPEPPKPTIQPVPTPKTTP